MLTKFFHGLAFGAGFAVTFLVISWLAAVYILPMSVPDELRATKEPTFENPKTAELKPQQGDRDLVEPDYNFFKQAGRHQIEIPAGGGILAMTVLPTELGAGRPRTFQLWLTERELWKVRTESTKVEIEQMAYPASEAVEQLDRIVFDSLGMGAAKSMMTVSSISIGALKRGEDCGEDDHLNGELRITTEGVVFLMPNELKR